MDVSPETHFAGAFKMSRVLKEVSRKMVCVNKQLSVKNDKISPKLFPRWADFPVFASVLTVLLGALSIPEFLCHSHLVSAFLSSCGHRQMLIY